MNIKMAVCFRHFFSNFTKMDHYTRYVKTNKTYEREVVNCSSSYLLIQCKHKSCYELKLTRLQEIILLAK